MKTAELDITPPDVRSALGHFATGVTVVTSVDAGGEPVGTTASAFSSLSLDPPLLLVCLAWGSETLAALRDRGDFAINVLAEGQQALSDNFARRGSLADWRAVAHTRGPGGSPHLHETLAVLDCSLHRWVDGGDHAIVIGRLRSVTLGAAERAPLLHFRGAYAGLQAAGR